MQKYTHTCTHTHSAPEGQRYTLLLDEDLGNNRRPSLALHVVKGDLVGPGGWSVIIDPKVKQESLAGVSLPSTVMW